MKKTLSAGLLVFGVIALLCSSQKCRDFVTGAIKDSGRPAVETPTPAESPISATAYGKTVKNSEEQHYVSVPSAESNWPSSTQQPATQQQGVSICTFNIQFLGNPKDRDNTGLAKIVEPYDLVVVQELVAPPYAGTFPDGTPYKPDAEAAVFFEAMRQLGFAYIMSEEDTGSSDRNHLNSSSTEWWVVFYKPSVVKLARDLPGGFLAQDRTNHPDFERVPYAFPFRTTDGRSDFVLISVHLQPDSGPAARARRKHELDAIARWIDANDEVEKDFIILGDMNIENQKELASATPAGFVSLNDQCSPTNTKGDKPYDHVMFNPKTTPEVDQTFDFVVIDLVQQMQPYWRLSASYPGTPYDHNTFRRYYSDHHPCVFRMKTAAIDDDYHQAASRPLGVSN